jgi:DNA-directed RNA polymerase subunit omega
VWKFFIASTGGHRIFPCSIGNLNREENVNSELCRLALIKVVNPNVLINLVSRRVRQLNSGGGNLSRPLLNDTTGLGAADIALTEIIEDKMGWEMPEELNLVDPAPKKRNKRG